MRKFLLLTSALMGSIPALSLSTRAQTSGGGSIDGLPYVSLTSPDGCSTVTPCQILEYLHPLGEQDQAAAQIQRYFNNAAFWSANPHTIVVAPMIPGSSSTNNWGDVSAGINNNMQAAVDLVQQIKATVPTNGATTLTGGSMGAIGGELLMSLYGPKGSQQAGIYQAGLFYDGAPYQISPAAMQSTLCGIPLTIVHGSADTTVSPIPDQNMAATLSGCPGFTFIPVPGFGHGTYSGAPQGYDSHTLIDQTMAAARLSATGTAATSTGTAQTSIPVQTSAVSSPTGIQSADIIPGGGSITADGHVWTISASGSILEDGRYTPGGGGTSDLMIVGGVVYGKDSGHGPVNPGGWFTLSGDGQSWAPSNPPPAAGSASTAALAAATAGPSGAGSATATSICNGSAAAGNFTVANGQIYTPNGQLFIASGINEQPGQQASVQQLQALFPGINFVRYASDYTQPVDEAYVKSLTDAGIVVEIEDHPWPTPGVYSGAQLQAETAWYAQLAADFKNNPNVWFGTMNEPSGASSAGVEDQELAIYNAVRGAGNNSMVMLELYGGGNPGTVGLAGGMTAGPYANMTNVAWDLHAYGWTSGYSSDPGTLAANIISSATQAQSITAAKGAAIPVIIGEFGNSTDGTSMDGDGSQQVAAVINSGYGFAAWQYGGASGSVDNLVSGSALTDYGQQVAAGIAANHAALAQCSSAGTVASVVPVNTLPAVKTAGAGSLTPINSLSTIAAPGS